MLGEPNQMVKRGNRAISVVQASISTRLYDPALSGSSEAPMIRSPCRSWKAIMA